MSKENESQERLLPLARGAFEITKTDGSGYIGMPVQSVIPAAPSGGTRVFLSADGPQFIAANGLYGPVVPRGYMYALSIGLVNR